jgi:hypothetical protein
MSYLMITESISQDMNILIICLSQSVLNIGNRSHRLSLPHKSNSLFHFDFIMISEQIQS